VLEVLLEHERATGVSDEVTAARRRGQDHVQFSFPRRYFYDVLRGLDYMRRAAVEPDERCAEAIDLVEKKRGKDRRWLLDNIHPGNPGAVHVDMDEEEGKPSRWKTLRARRALDWCERGPAR